MSSARTRDIAVTHAWRLPTRVAAWVMIAAGSMTLSRECLPQPATRTYTVLVAGRVEGKQVDSPLPNGAIRVSYEYNDRGRGPHLESIYNFGTGGVLSSVHITGRDYNRAPVNEQFRLENGQASWKSNSEQGQALGKGWYVSANGPPIETAWLARALLRSKDQSVPLLPSGRATIERGTKLNLSSNGNAIQVTRYGIGGLAFMPVSVWLDNQDEFFASGDPLILTIREGWERAKGRLLDAQAADDDARFQRLASGLKHTPANGLLFRHVRVFDSQSATVLNDQAVLVKRNRIKDVTPDTQATAPHGLDVIDGTGKTMLPGLFDMHSHFSPEDGLLNLASGVTSVRDLGNDMDRLLALKQQYDSGQAIGPRIFLAGVIDGRGPYSAPTNVLADTEEEARAAIDRYAANGYIQIKIYSSLKPTLVPTIVRMAHAKGLRVSGHVPSGMLAEEFVNDGVDEIQHINFLFLNFLASQTTDTAGRARMSLVAEHAAELDLSSDHVEQFIALLRRKQIVIDPTLGVFEGLYVARPGSVSPSYASIAKRLPLQVKRAAFQGGIEVPEGKDEVFRNSFRAMQQMVLKLYNAGVPLVIGTDGVQGLMLHRELELWVAAGIPPAKVLQMATLGGAQVNGADKDLGSVTPGKKADVILVDGDPMKNISDIRKCRLAIKDGVLYYSDALYRASGIATD